MGPCLLVPPGTVNEVLRALFSIASKHFTVWACFCVVQEKDKTHLEFDVLGSTWLWVKANGTSLG